MGCVTGEVIDPPPHELSQSSPSSEAEAPQSRPTDRERTREEDLRPNSNEGSWGEGSSARKLDTPVLPDAAYVEMISSSTVAKFPHLENFEGHVLLGSARTQVVLAGVPPENSFRTWQPGVLGFFSWDRGKWRAITSLGSMDLAKPGSGRRRSRQPRTPLALELGVDGSRQWAWVRFLYQHPDSKSPSKRLGIVYRLLAKSERLTVAFVGPKKSASRSKVEDAWNIRFRTGNGTTQTSKSEDLKGLSGSLVWLRYFRGQTTALVGTRPFEDRSKDGIDEIDVEGHRSGSSRPLYEGYELLIGREGARWAPVVREAVRRCHYGIRPIGPSMSPGTPTPIDTTNVPLPQRGTEKVSEDSGPAHLADSGTGVNSHTDRGRRGDVVDRVLGAMVDFDRCMAKIPMGYLNVKVAADDVGGDLSPQPTYIFSPDQSPLLYTPHFAGRQLKIPLPASQSMTFATRRTGDKDAAALPLQLGANQEQEILLPARKAADLIFDPGNDLGPFLLVINKRHVPPGEPGFHAEKMRSAPSGLSPATGPSSAFGSSNAFLATNWPVNLSLVQGEYELALKRGFRRGVQSPNQSTDCRMNWKAVPGDLSQLTCEIAVSQNPNDGPGIYADFASVIKPEDRDLYRQLLGVDWIAGSSAHGGAQVLGTLSVFDRRAGRSLTAYGIDASFHESWLISGGDAGLSLARFASEVRRVGGWLELGCPGPSQSLDDYARDARSLRPDALRLWGCAYGSVQEELLAVMGELQKDLEQPLRLTSTGALRQNHSYHGFPRLFFAETGLRQNGRGVLGAMRQGRYSLTQGGRIRVRHLAKGSTKAKKRRHIALTATVRMQQFPGFEARNILVYTESGERFRQRVAEEEAVQVLTFEFEVPRGDRWIRFELRGAGETAVSSIFDRGDGLHLASTNFLDIKMATR